MNLVVDRRTSGPTIVFTVACIVTCALYWSGLHGPLLFDDYANLAPVDDWLQGRSSSLSVLFPNPDSIVFSRPLAMASFMLTSWLWDGIFGLKLGNLLLHLACGFVVWRALRRIMLACADLSENASWASSLAACIWLLHPLQASTVLYGVQRMAQLSAVFVVLAVWCYVLARQRLFWGNRSSGLLSLFVAVPILVGLGLLGKQNAVVAPLVCLGIEISCFRGKRPRAVHWFFALSLALPVIAVAALLIFSPERILGGYNELEFTVAQKLWTQPRALLDYVLQWFAPYSPAMGLYTDAYPVSSGPLSPLSTLAAIVALSGITIIAILLRRTAPSILAGWLFFLAAHAVESSFLPIEMYYEHRNYLPSVGLMLFAAGVIATLLRHAPQLAGNRRLTSTAFAALCLALSFATLGRVVIWRDELAMTEQGMRQHPDSLRVYQDRLSLMLRLQDETGARAVVSHLTAHPMPRQRLIGAADRIVVDCMFGHPTNMKALSGVESLIQPRLTVYEVHVAHLLETATRLPACRSPEIPLSAATLISRIVSGASDQDTLSANKSMMRRIAGQLYARSGRWDLALGEAELAWAGERNLPNASLLIRAKVHTSDTVSARVLLAEMKTLRDANEPIWQREIDALSGMISRKN